MKIQFPQQLDSFGLELSLAEKNAAERDNIPRDEDVWYLLAEIEAKLGCNDSAIATSVEYRLNHIEEVIGATVLPGLGDPNEILGVDGVGSGLEYKTIYGTANQITITHAAGSVTFSLPNTIIASTDASLSLNSGWAASKINLDDGELNYQCDKHSIRTFSGTLIAEFSTTLGPGIAYANASSQLSTVSNVAAGSVLTSGTPPSYTALGDILGTANQVTVTGGIDKIVGSDVTLSLPQNIHTAGTPQFAKIGIGAAAGTNVLEVTGNTLGTGYLRVGSLTAPNNTTAGDLTVTRFSLGNTSLSAGNSQFFRADGTLTDGTATNAIAFGFFPFCNLSANASAGTAVNGLWTQLTLSDTDNFVSAFANRIFNNISSSLPWTGSLTGVLVGQQVQGLTSGVSTTFGTIAQVIAHRSQALSLSGSLAGTITAAYGHRIIDSSNSSSVTLTTLAGLGIDEQTIGTNKTNLVIGTVATGTWSIYNNSTRDNFFNGNLGLAISPTERLHVSGNAIITGSIYQDDIPKPYVTVAGDAQGRTFTVAVKKFNNTATAYTRYVVSWWVSTSQDGAPSKPSNQTVAVGNGSGTGAQTLSGTPNTPTWCVAETDSAGEVKITVSNTQTGAPATVYFHCEVLGARFTASGTVNTAAA